MAFWDDPSKRTRLAKELAAINKGEVSGIHAEEFYNNLCDNIVWSVTFDGAESTPFEGLKYEARVFFNSRHPVIIPSVYFTRHIFHPNVCPRSGRFCGDAYEWNSSYCMSAFLASIYATLNTPCLDRYMDDHACRIFRMDTKVYRKVHEGFMNDDNEKILFTMTTASQNNE